MDFDFKTLIGVILVIIFVVAVSLPILQNLIGDLGSSANFVETFAATAFVPVSLSHPVTSVISMNRTQATFAANSTNVTLPGNQVYKLIQPSPNFPAILHVIHNTLPDNTTQVTVNGHIIGNLTTAGTSDNITFDAHFLNNGSNTIHYG